MMANKKFRLNEIIDQNIVNNHIESNYVLKRDSFSDRFCDDLCQIIINYLSIEDKIRFECISKQFQRLIFNKQKVLEIKGVLSGGKDNLFKLLKSIGREGDDFGTNVYEIDIKSFEKVLKKLKFLNKISFGYFFVNNKCEVLNTITDNCNHLKSIEFDFNKVNEQTLVKFGQKFGQDLEVIIFKLIIPDNLDMSQSDKKLLIKLLPNLLEINGIKIEDLIDKNEVYVKNVRKLVNFTVDANKNELLEMFVERYSNTIESLHINLYFKDTIERNYILKQISLLKNLKILNILSDDCDYYLKSFADNMKSIAVNCKQLTELSFTLIRKQSFDTKHGFNSFGNFTHLRKLSFSTTFSLTEDEEYDINCLKNSKLITYLRLNTPKINDNFFNGIDSIVPQLKHLQIRSNEGISDKALNSISKLNNLEVLSFGRMQSSNQFNLITDLGLISLINSCQKLKSIVLHKRPNITNKTIEALISMALKNPRICFNHYFQSIGRRSDGFTAIDLETYDSLPINLKIN